MESNAMAGIGLALMQNMQHMKYSKLESSRVIAWQITTSPLYYSILVVGAGIAQNWWSILLWLGNLIYYTYHSVYSNGFTCSSFYAVPTMLFILYLSYYILYLICISSGISTSLSIRHWRLVWRNGAAATISPSPCFGLTRVIYSTPASPPSAWHSASH